MGVTQFNRPCDELTPICNDCGIALCWGISFEEYKEKRAFWDAWRCEECDPKAVGSRKRDAEVNHDL